MKRKISITVVVLVIALFVALLLYFYITREPGNKYQWSMSMKHDSDQPYGTLFIKKLLESREGNFKLNDRKPLYELLDSIDYQNGNTDYVLIGQSVHFDEDDISKLMGFMNAGNDVFIATMAPPEELVKAMYENPCDKAIQYSYDLDTAVYANFYHPSFHKQADYEFRFRFGASDFPYLWRYLDPTVICNATVPISSLGYQQVDRVNFLRIPSRGSGHLYLHTNPLMFTNYFLTKDDKLEYASSVFSHLSGDNIIWDEVSKIPFTDTENPYDSPLYFILQQESLKYAWWMLMGGALLYMIFASKRTQRIIPVLETKTNTSLEFLQVISSLHYTNSDHLDMARKKMKYFQYFIRARYGVNAQALTPDAIKKLSEKSKIPATQIEDILAKYKLIEDYGQSEDNPARLEELYQLIEKFYKNCK